LRTAFTELEVVNLTLMISTINAWNRMAIALGRQAEIEVQD
jgi:alkylhydroperoxidase family enzyme